jgi:hypothetical protein
MQNGIKMREGYGILIQPYREEYKGNWKLDKMHGEGAYRYTSGAYYQGEWENGMANGKVQSFRTLILIGSLRILRWKYL